MAQLLLGDLDLLAGPYMAQVGTSYGMWQAITTTSASLFLDGSVVSGEQSGNRTIELKVRVAAEVRPVLVRACELLFAEANQPANTLMFVPDDGPRMVYDVFRAQPERTDDEAETPYGGRWRRTYTFTFPAQPFTRSDERTSTGALAPAVTLADFESATSGILVNSGARDTPGSEWGMPYDTSLAESSWVQVARAPSFTADTGCSVLNGTTETTGRGAAPAAKITATTSGLIEAHVTAAGATSAVAVVGGVNIHWSGPPRLFQVGVEWLDASSNTVSTEWGEPQAGRNAELEAAGSPSWAGGTVWVASVRPAAATKARLRLRVPSAVNAEVYPVLGGAIVPLTQGTIPTVSPFAHDGTHSVALGGVSLNAAGSGGYSRPSNPQAYGYLRVALPAPVDISAKGLLQVWSGMAVPDRPLGNDFASITLSDASGKWSRYDSFTATAVGADGWQSLAWPLATPAQASTAGPANLAAVTSVSVSAIRAADSAFASSNTVFLDGIQAVDQPTATNSVRGTVYQLDVVGSARSPARVGLSAATPLTDFVVASVFSDAESPMLKVASSVATSPAPSVYDGVYSVIGCVAPATVLASPSCVVAQLIDGTQVASTTLTGLTAAGNHYVDFGQVPLPLVPVPDENVSVSYTFTLTPSSSAWAEVLVLNAAAPLTWVPNLDTARKCAWVDEPVLPAQVGRIFVGDATDRSDARGLLVPPVQSRPFQVAAPSTRLLIYSTTTAPGGTLGYYAHWLVEPDE